MPVLSGAPRNSLLVWQTAPGGPGDTPATILPAVIERLRALNREDAARELSLAITHCEEALHWLESLAERRST
ncbi:MAG: hypothetical protein ACRDGQ_06710 [Candidatus Limnocylindrales bacterium]